MAVKVAYEFGGFRFEPFNARLLYGTTVIPLTVKAADTLAVLVRQPDTLVTKEDLMAAVWRDTAVEENNLNQQISALRKALAQNGNGSFIETVPRRGYRFVGTVRAIPAGLQAPEDIGLPVEPAAVGPLPAEATTRVTLRGGFARRHLVSIAAGAVLLIATGSAVGWKWQERQRAARLSEAATQRGDELLRRGDAAGAAAELQYAIKLDSRNALAYGALAHALHKQSPQASVVRVSGRSPSVDAAAKGVSLDPKCATCQGTLGFFLFYHDWQWTRAEEHLREAIRLGPEQESIRPSYAMLLAATGRPREAQEQLEFALSKQPYRLTWRMLRASTLYFQRRYTDAMVATDEALALNDSDRGTWEWRSKALVQLGRHAEAVRAVAQSASSQNTAEVDRVVRENGADAGLRRLLEISDAWPARVEQSRRRAEWRALLGERDEALNELERALEHRNLNLIYIAVDPVYDTLRSEPRFKRVLAALGLDSVVSVPAEEVVRR